MISACSSRACTFSLTSFREALSIKQVPSFLFKTSLISHNPPCYQIPSTLFPCPLRNFSKLVASAEPFSKELNFQDLNFSSSAKNSIPRQWINGGGWFYEGADIDSSAIVEAGAVVHSGASIGPLSRIGSGSIVGSDVSIGRETILNYNVKLQNCTVGDYCILYNGVAVGQDGFGFYVDDKGNMMKKPQELRVVIGNEVEVGANTCIDRGSWRDTVIGDQTKIDNLVQIGHNVVIGRCCIICGQVGIGGSATIGDFVVIAGQVGVADHVKITSKVRIAAKSGVSANIDTPGDYAGFPVMNAREWRKMIALQRRAVKHEKLNPYSSIDHKNE